MALGKGTAIVRRHLEAAAAAAAALTGGAAVGSLGMTAEGQLADAGALLGGSSGVDAAEAVITAHERASVKLLEELKVVLEANQSRRKPKVRTCV